MGKRAAPDRHTYALPLRLLLTGALVGAVLILIAGLSAPFPRAYAGWSGEALVDLLSGGNTVPSQIAPIAWSGVGPLTVQGLPLRRGCKLEIKLRADHGRVVVRMLIDGQPVAHLDVRPRWRTYRVWLHHDGARLRLEGAAGVPIHIARIKVTNVAGFTEGLLNAWIIRRGQPFRPARHDSSWVLLLTVVGIALVLLLVPDTAGRAASPGYRRCAVGLAVMAVVLAVGRLAAAGLGFRLIFTPGTAAAVLLLPAAAVGGWTLARRARVPRVPVAAVWRKLRTPLVVGGVLVLWAVALLVLVGGRFGGDIRGIARFGWRFSLSSAVKDVPELSRPGYDGQFYATLASDPFLRDPTTVRGLDNPAYRGTRVLVPLLAWLSVGGSARLGPFAYVVWCWILGLGGPVIVLVWLRASGWRFLLFTLLAINAGLVVSLVRATPDAAALTLMLGALLVGERTGRPAAAAAGGTLAVLARETSALAVPGLVWPELKAGRWRQALGMILAPPVALGSWWFYLREVTHRRVGSEWRNFGLPFGWLPEKVRRVWGAGWEHGKVEWIGLAWVLLLVGVAMSYLVRRKRATPALITFLLFAALAVVLNMRVYTEVNAYARVLIALPFLAAVLAAEERLRWRRGLLIAGVVIASIQGGLVLDHETVHAWQAWRRRGDVHLRETRLAGFAISGAKPEPGRPWKVPAGRHVRLVSVAGTQYVTLRALDGRAVIRRAGRRLVRLGAPDVAVLPLPRGGGYLELVAEGRNPVEMAPVTTSSSRPGIPGGAMLVPVVAGTGGLGGTRWETNLALRSTAAEPQQVTLMFLPRQRDGWDRMWAQLTIDPGRGFELDDVVPTVFGVSSAGAMLVAATEPGLSIRCRIGHRTGDQVSWATVPVIPPADPSRIAGAPWSLEAPLGRGNKRASVILVNPTAGAATARLKAGTDSGGLVDTVVSLGAWEVRQLGAELGERTGTLRVTVRSAGGVVPVGVLSVTDNATGRVRLYCSSGAVPVRSAP